MITLIEFYSFAAETSFVVGNIIGSKISWAVGAFFLLLIKDKIKKGAKTYERPRNLSR